MGNKVGTVQKWYIEGFLGDLVPLGVPKNGAGSEDLTTGRFLRTVKFNTDEGAILVKIFPKRGENLVQYEERLTVMKEKFCSIHNPNVFPWQAFFQTERAGYLVRQFFRNHLSDRVGTRPFLSQIEKKWIAFQLIMGLAQAHYHGLCHGDIKSENVLVTSWNWIFLADFSPFKPTYIPSDDPADFSFYFDTSGTRNCYLAPERFYSGISVPDGPLTPAMDIFSVGCVIAELFLDGKSIFDLGQLLSYRKGDYDPASRLKKIDDDVVQSLITHMIQKEPEKRFTALEYLEKWSGILFPRGFHFLHAYIGRCTKLNADDKVFAIAADFPAIVSRLTSVHDVRPISLPATPATTPVKPTPLTHKEETAASESPRGSDTPTHTPTHTPSDTPRARNRSSSSSSEHTGLLQATQALVGALESGTAFSHAVTDNLERSFDETQRRAKEALLLSTLPPSHSASPTPQGSPTKDQPARNTTATTEEPAAGQVDQLVILLSLVLTHIHTLRTPLAKITTLNLFLSFAEHLDDEIRLQRLVAYIRRMLSDSCGLVRGAAIRTLCRMLDMVKVFPPSESNIFSEYIIPALSPLLSDSEDWVRVVYAENVAHLAEIAKRFLEAYQYSKQPVLSDDPTKEVDESQMDQTSYDKELYEIQSQFWKIVQQMLSIESSTSVKATILEHMSRLSKFFGRKKTMEDLIPLTSTFFNQNDWQVRAAFFSDIVGVCEFVGPTHTENLYLPLAQVPLSQNDELVTYKAISATAALCRIDLFRTPVMFSMARDVAPMLCHPNIWIRHAMVSLFVAIAKQLTPADVYCFLMPVLRPFVLCTLVDVTEESLLEALKRPVSRASFDRAIQIVNDIEARERGSQAPAAPRAALLDSRPDPDVKDPSDAFEIAFVGRMREIGFARDEIQALASMKPYLRSLARSLRSQQLQQRGQSSTDLVVIGEEKLTSAQTYSVPYNEPPHGPNAATRNLVASARVRHPGLLSPQGELITPSNEAYRPTANPTRFDGKRTEEELHMALAILPPPAPDLGTPLPLPVTPEPVVPAKDFRPKGVLVAHFHEHRAAVNEVQVSDDQGYFVSASDDGTVKIWDCSKIEKNVTNRARFTYKELAGRIKAVTFLEGTQSVACGSDTGAVHVFRIESASKTNANGTIGRTFLPCGPPKYRTASEGAVVAVSNYSTQTQSLVLYATTKGRVHWWDLRVPREAKLMANPLPLGIVQDFAVEPARNWLVTATSRGFFVVWDVRYNLPVHTWRHPFRSRVYAVSSLRGNRIVSAGPNNVIDAWDLETGQARLQMRVEEHAKPAVLTTAPLQAISQLEPLDYGLDEVQPAASRTDSSVRALLCPGAGHDCLITAGADKRIRFWDLERPSASYTVAGLEAGSARSSYSAVFQGETQVIQESPSAHDRVPQLEGPRSPLPSVNHHDAILDLQLIELPHKMLISSSRDGVIKVWK